jgi:hypothetical protein
VSCGRLFVTLALALTIGAVCIEPALATGGRYTVVGGSSRNAAEVKKALNASRFDWSLVQEQITIHVVAGKEASSTPGHIWLSPELLASGSFAWGVVQHEYAHQIDFFLLNDAKRGFLTKTLRAAGWCHEVSGLRHDRYGCERFASTLAWAYWPDSRNALRPRSAQDESAAMKPAPFRALLTSLIGAADPFAPALRSRPR